MTCPMNLLKAQTWMCVANTEFRWTNKETLRLVRTSPHGQRHICARCSGALTIVYNAQPESIWPAAGGFEDALSCFVGLVRAKYKI